MNQIKSVYLLLIIVLSSAFCGCSTMPPRITQVENYKEFVERINYESTPEFKFNDTINKWIIAQPKIIMNSKSLYDNVKLINGDYQLVTIGGKNFLDNLSGDRVDVSNLLGENYDINNLPVNFAYDKFLTMDSGNYGLSDIHGNIILQTKFNSIEYMFDLAKAVDDNGCYLYKSGKLMATVDLWEADKIELFDNNIVKFYNVMCDIELNELFVEYYDRQYRVVNYNKGQYIIEDYSGYLGYYDTRGNFIEPRFDNISFFGSTNSDASTVATIGDKSYIINYNGEVVYTAAGTLFDNCFDGYYFSQINGISSILDRNFQKVNLSPTINLVYERAFDNNIVVYTDNGMTFFDLQRKALYNHSFVSIKPINSNYFICKNFDGTFALLDRTLTVVFDYFQEIEVFDKFLKIKVLNVYKILTIAD